MSLQGRLGSHFNSFGHVLCAWFSCLVFCLNSGLTIIANHAFIRKLYILRLNTEVLVMLFGVILKLSGFTFEHGRMVASQQPTVY